MALDPIPASWQSDGNWTITYIPTGSNPLSVAILNGATAKDLTYSFTPDGFNYSTAETEVPDKRLTLIQDLSRPGKTKDSLELKYVDSDDAASAATLLVPGLAGFFVVRRKVANGAVYAIGQKPDVITFVLGAQRIQPPTENGLDVYAQTVYFTSVTQPKATLVA